MKSTIKLAIIIFSALWLSGCMHTVSYDSIGGAHWRVDVTADGK